jgi:hypothetical protein
METAGELSSGRWRKESLLQTVPLPRAEERGHSIGRAPSSRRRRFRPRAAWRCDGTGCRHRCRRRADADTARCRHRPGADSGRAPPGPLSPLLCRRRFRPRAARRCDGTGLPPIPARAACHGNTISTWTRCWRSWLRWCENQTRANFCAHSSECAKCALRNPVCAQKRRAVPGAGAVRMPRPRSAATAPDADLSARRSRCRSRAARRTVAVAAAAPVPMLHRCRFRPRAARRCDRRRSRSGADSGRAPPGAVTVAAPLLIPARA